MLLAMPTEVIMLELVLTTSCCKKILEHLLKQPGWSIAHVARIIGTPDEYVSRIAAKKQSFQVRDVELLSQAVGMRPAMLLFASTKRSEFSLRNRRLYDMAAEMIHLQEEFEQSLNQKTSRKRRATRKVA
jgi:plasmid maintenance system antidote protein VapI